ncbi:MAG: inositol monophosphatase family protein [Chloroflexota bacterium]
MILIQAGRYNLTMDYQKTLETAEVIALEAGELLKKGFWGDKSFDLKSSDIDLVTEYDQAAERLIRERIYAAFPSHRIVGEEEGADEGDGEIVWYVDPIDGTTNFAHGVPHFSVSLGLYIADQAVVGVVYNPITGEMFSGAAGHGAHFKQNGEVVRPLRVTQTDQLSRALLETGFPYDRATSDLDNVAQLSRVVKKCRGLRRLGSAALAMAYVADGRTDAYWEFKLNMYDIGAGVVLVQEAGGQVCIIPDGEPFAPADIVHVLASGDDIKAPLLELL